MALCKGKKPLYTFTKDFEIPSWFSSDVSQAFLATHGALALAAQSFK